MKRLLSMLAVLFCVFPALGAYRFNPISTNTPAGMTNVILDVAALGTNSWSTNSVSAIRATGSAYATNFVGQLSPTNYNNGTGAAVTTFLRGDGTWVNPSTGSATNAIGNLDGLGTNTVIYNGLTSEDSTTNKGTVYFPNALTAGDGKIMVIDQVTKSVKTAQNAGVTNGQFWGTFKGDGSLITGLTNDLATQDHVLTVSNILRTATINATNDLNTVLGGNATNQSLLIGLNGSNNVYGTSNVLWTATRTATNAMNGANWTFGNIAGNGLLLTNLRTNATAADGVLPAAGSYPFSGWFTDNNGVPLWREFYYITNSFPLTLFFNITGNAGTATTATNAMLLSSTGIGLADTNWVLSQVASLGSYLYFGGPTNTFAITNSGETVSRTNVFTGSTGPFSQAATSTVSGLTLNAYVRHVISTNRFNVIEAGPVSIVTYPFRSGGAGTVSGHYEFYVVDCVSNIMYELAAGPVTVISATVPTAIQTSLSLTNAFIATNQCYFAIAFKMDSIGSGGPSLHWAHGGAYDAHVTFTRPLSSATINASQIVGVLSTNNIPTNYIQYGSGSGISISNNVASAPHIDLETNGSAWFSSNVVLGAGSKYYGDGSSLSNLTGVAANAITNNNQGDVNLTNLNVYGILRGSDIRVDDLIVTNPPAFDASAMTNFPALGTNQIGGTPIDGYVPKVDAASGGFVYGASGGSSLTNVTETDSVVTIKTNAVFDGGVTISNSGLSSLTFKAASPTASNSPPMYKFTVGFTNTHPGVGSETTNFVNSGFLVDCWDTGGGTNSGIYSYPFNVYLNDQSVFRISKHGNVYIDGGGGNSSAGMYLTKAGAMIQFQHANISVTPVSDSATYDMAIYRALQLSTGLPPMHLTGPDGSGANANGGSLYLAGGRSTGNGTPGPVGIRTGLIGGSGSTLRGQSTRYQPSHKVTELTESTATTNLLIYCGTNQYVGGTLQYTITASDGTARQALSGLATFSAINSNGVFYAEALAITDPSGNQSLAQYPSGGTLTATWAIAQNSSTNVAITCSAVSSLTQTSLNSKWQVHINSDGWATVTAF